GVHARVGGDGSPVWGNLVSRREGVHAELFSQGHTRAVVALAEDPITAAVLATACPDYDEVPARVGSDGGKRLVPHRVCVDLELAALRHAPAVVALAEAAPFAAVLA